MQSERNNFKILVVDDEPSLAEILRDKFTIEGYEVDIAKNGEEGLQCLMGRKYDVIILDMVMPKMNGLEFLDEVNKIGIKPIIVGLSNSANGTMAAAISKGITDYFIKSDLPMRKIVEYIKSKLEPKVETEKQNNVK